MKAALSLAYEEYKLTGWLFTESEKIMLLIKLSCAIQQQGQISGYFHKQTKISGQH